MSNKDSSIEIVTKRVFDAPRRAVWEAFEDPQQLARWWGPNGFTNEFSKFEFRPGGSWVFVMRGPNGHAYPNESLFTEIVRPERIVLDHVVQPIYRNTMSFVEGSGKTELTWHAVFQVDTPNEKFRDFLIQANEQNFDRLAAHLA